MAQLLKCSRGHTWLIDGDSTVILEGPAQCPECGQSAVSGGADAGVLCQTLETSTPELPACGPTSDQTVVPPDAAPAREAVHSDATLHSPDLVPQLEPSSQTQVLPDVGRASQPGRTTWEGQPPEDLLSARTGEWTVADQARPSEGPTASPQPRRADHSLTEFDPSLNPDQASQATLGIEASSASADPGSVTVDPESGQAVDQASCATMDVGESRLVPDSVVRVTRAKTRAVDVPPERAPTSRPQVSGYEILKELGRGAMGVVYKARQIKADRLVALKMVLAGHQAGVRVLARFEIEAQAIARLHHPNIVQLFEAGDQDGCPFFSLEYVEGGTLEQRLAGKPGGPREVAWVVQQLAEAMDYAHRWGVIHRDLKPANILMAFKSEVAAGEPPAAEDERALTDFIPKVTDFGLAKRLESDSRQTKDGSIMGTPSYMAPEQAEGNVDEVGPAADIYALGAILYDLLTGRPPFQGKTVLETLQQVKKLEPTPPRKLLPRLPHDLDTICLKCLEKEPEKRYSSAGDLALDLQRFLGGEPIHARPVPPWERAWKWCRRQPAAACLVGLSVVVALTLMIGGPILAHHEFQQARTEADLRKEAEERREEADKQRKLAEDNFHQAEKAVNEMLTRIGGERLENEPRMERVRRDLLEAALRFYQEFLKDKPDNPELRLEVGRAATRVGEIHDLLGEPDQAEKAYREAQQTLEALTRQFGDRLDYRVALARAYYRQGELLRDRYPRRAEAEYRKAIDLLRSEGENPTPNVEAVRTLSSAYRGLGVTLLASGNDRKQADEMLTRALELKERLANAYPGQRVYRFELGKSYNDMGLLLKENKRLVESERTFAYAAELLDKLVKEHARSADYHQELIRTMTNQAGVLLALGQAGQAETLLRQVLDRREELVKQHPNVPDYQFEKARTLHLLASVLLQTLPPQPEQASARRAEAEKRHREALDLLRKLNEVYPREPDYRHGLIQSLDALADLQAKTNRVKEARSLREEALGLSDALVHDYPTKALYAEQLAKVLSNLGTVLGQDNQRKKAQEYLRQALALFELLIKDQEKKNQKEEPRYKIGQAMTLGELGIVQFRDRQPEKAEKTFRQAIAILQQLDRDHPNQPAVWIEELNLQRSLAEFYREQTMPDERQKCLKRMEELRAKTGKK